MFYILKETDLTKQEVTGVPYYWGEAESLAKGANCFTLSNYILFRQTGKIFIPPEGCYLKYPSDNHLPTNFIKEVCYEKLGEPDVPNVELEKCIVLLKYENKYGVGATFKDQNQIYIAMTGSYGNAKSTVHNIRALRRHQPVFWSIEKNPQATKVETYFGNKKNGRPANPSQ